MLLKSASFRKYTFVLNQYKVHLNSRLIKKDPENRTGEFTVDSLTFRQQRHGHEKDNGQKTNKRYNVHSLNLGRIYVKY